MIAARVASESRRLRIWKFGTPKCFCRYWTRSASGTVPLRLRNSRLTVLYLLIPMIRANNREGWLDQDDIIMGLNTLDSQRRYHSTVITLIQPSRIRKQSWSWICYWLWWLRMYGPTAGGKIRGSHFLSFVAVKSCGDRYGRRMPKCAYRPNEYWWQRNWGSGVHGFCRCPPRSKKVCAVYKNDGSEIEG